MKILTFDIEDWYCHDNLSRNFDWDKYEVRIYDGVDKILSALDEHHLKGTFFCLGWIAEHHPDVIKRIATAGHQIGCHSYQHELATRFDKAGFMADTKRAKDAIENVTAREVTLFRAPAFSITADNLYAFDTLVELGFTTDCSVFPARRDYGGMPEYGYGEPGRLMHNGVSLKEFPINPARVCGRRLVYSGGGYFRLMPYPLIKRLTSREDYVMTYFHPSDFDPAQPQMNYLPPLRRWKNHVGLEGAYSKFCRYISEFDFVNVEAADKMVDWNNTKVISLG